MTLLRPHDPPVHGNGMFPGAAGFGRRLARLAAFAAAVFAAQAVALDIAGPSGSVSFGTSVKVLPNGNIVVTDPDADAGPTPGVGAVYLYGPNGNVISTLKGSQPYDHVGSEGIVVLANGNYVITSRQWRNDTAANAGAVTWASAVTGVSGVVSSANSLVGGTTGDGVGVVTALTNGNYVVSSPGWDNVSIVDAGAVTWCNGNGSTVGAVSASNSLVGTSTGDSVGYLAATALNNGNYVASSPLWDSGDVADVGAVTWGDGNGGTVGAVSAGNSLVGSTSGDVVGQVVALSNGNYVVSSSSWSNGSTLYVGAVTWGNGAGGTVGEVSASNSLIGSHESDEVGNGVTVLNNGNYVVSTLRWNSLTGAATWGDGTGGTTGEVSASNSLVGTVSGDRVSADGIAALSNGSYVVASASWNGEIGAATWGNGGGGTVGAVSTSNSLVGTQAKDRVGYFGVAALLNGNYVVNSATWNGGIGALTWGYGNGGTVGEVSTGNSLVGTNAGDLYGGVAALSDGNYVAYSISWDNGGIVDAGSATWCGGSAFTADVVSPGNSLVGSSTNDSVGSGGAVVLSNGRYVVVAPYWDNGGTIDAGAVTWGRTGAVAIGPVSAANSLVGSVDGDSVGSSEVTAVGNRSYVVVSPSWHNGDLVDAGAVTLRRDGDRLGATITAENSVRGGVASGGDLLVYDYDAARDQLVVGRPAENIATLFRADLLLRDGFE